MKDYPLALAVLDSNNIPEGNFENYFLIEPVLMSSNNIGYVTPIPRKTIPCSQKLPDFSPQA